MLPVPATLDIEPIRNVPALMKRFPVYADVVVDEARCSTPELVVLPPKMRLPAPVS